MTPNRRQGILIFCGMVVVLAVIGVVSFIAGAGGSNSSPSGSSASQGAGAATSGSDQSAAPIPSSTSVEPQASDWDKDAAQRGDTILATVSAAGGLSASRTFDAVMQTLTPALTSTGREQLAALFEAKDWTAAGKGYERVAEVTAVENATTAQDVKDGVVRATVRAKTTETQDGQVFTEGPRQVWDVTLVHGDRWQVSGIRQVS